MTTRQRIQSEIDSIRRKMNDYQKEIDRLTSILNGNDANLDIDPIEDKNNALRRSGLLP